MKIAILGGGNMGEAFSKGLLQRWDMVKRPLNIHIGEHNEEKHTAFHGLEVTVSKKNAEVVHGADVIILAVKPVAIEALCKDITKYSNGSALFISIAAGMKMARIERALGKKVPLVRVMPNLLAKIGESMSVWTSNTQVTDKQKKLVQLLLSSVGKELEVDDEDAIDKATAVSGSGPAYIWYLMELMIAGGVDIGLTEEQSRLLTIQTVRGAARMLDATTDDVSTLRQKVTSKGGTTERTLQYFDKMGFDEIVKKAIEVCYKRAKELGE